MTVKKKVKPWSVFSSLIQNMQCAQEHSKVCILHPALPFTTLSNIDKRLRRVRNIHYTMVNNTNTSCMKNTVLILRRHVHLSFKNKQTNKQKRLFKTISKDSELHKNLINDWRRGRREGGGIPQDAYQYWKECTQPAYFTINTWQILQSKHNFSLSFHYYGKRVSDNHRTVQHSHVNIENIQVTPPPPPTHTHNVLRVRPSTCTCQCLTKPATTHMTSSSPKWFMTGVRHGNWKPLNLLKQERGWGEGMRVLPELLFLTEWNSEIMYICSGSFCAFFF